MATTLLTEIKPYMFTSELSRFSYKTTLAASSFSIVSSAGDVLFENEYIPDGAGKITVHGLDKLLPDFIAADTQPSFSFKIDGGTVGSFIAVECNVNVDETANTFLSKCFLTSMQSMRDTTMNRYELLSAFNPTNTEFKVEALYLDPLGNPVKKTFRNIPATSTADKIKTYNVSPVMFKAVELGELVGLTALCGDRRLSYRVLLYPEPFDPAFIFRNSFGCWETIFFPGEKTTDSQFTRSASTFDGQFITYDIDEILMLTASTGLMSAGSERLARDVARSMAVFLLNDDGSTGQQVTITDCSVKSTNSDELLPAFTFTYRHASSNEIEFAYVPYYRIFDLTFDLTYE